MVDAEYVLRFLTLSQNWEKFSGDLRGAFDYFMQKNRFPPLDALEDYRHKFVSCITVAEAIWGTRAFKRPGRDQVLAGLYDAQMVALSMVRSSMHEVLIRRRDTVVQRADSLFDNQRFDEAVRLGTNTPARLRERITEMLRTLLQVAQESQ
jgi:hypothetical protein